jgi:hypothetical protein
VERGRATPRQQWASPIAYRRPSTIQHINSGIVAKPDGVDRRIALAYRLATAPISAYIAVHQAISSLLGHVASVLPGQSVATGASNSPTNPSIPSNSASQETKEVVQSKKFTPDETAGLREVFKGGGDEPSIAGAQRLLHQLDKGPVKLPLQVTRDVLERYARLAQGSIDDGTDKLGVQALRLRPSIRSLGSKVMTIDQTSLQALKDRGIELNPPVRDSDFELVRNKLSIEPGADFKSVYGSFNGFLAHDEASMLMLWDINQIVSSRDLYNRSSTRSHVIPIGDYFIDSDIIMASISDESEKVSLLFENRELAGSIEEFVSLLAAGAFDSR